MQRRLVAGLALLVLARAAPPTANAVTPDRHVVIVVWDGMRPDFVSEQTTPTLWKLANEGVIFRNNHAVFPTATNVNGAALATGTYPGRNGILANHVYRPEFDPNKPVDVEAPPVVEKGDLWSRGKYVALPTLPELVQEAGGSSVVATAKTVGLLWDRQYEPERGARKPVTLFAGNSLPGAVGAALVKSLGTFPPAGNAAARDTWTTRALTESLWHDGIPNFSLLWLGEPDDTQHKTAPGAPPAMEAVKAADTNLAQVLAALDRRHLRESTDIIVVSDHGFSTIRRMIDLPHVLTQAGFKAVTELSAGLQPGQIMMVGNGGAVLFYVAQQDASMTQRLVDLLQQSDFSGVIFTRRRLEGTFPLARGKIDNDITPDVVLAFRWTAANNQFDRPGLIDADWQRAAGKGTHATLSRFDLHNTLIAAGPDFRRGLTSELPSGNIDVAPTVLHILGLNAPNMDGRILTEALVKGDKPNLQPESDTIEATNEFPIGHWRQYIKFTRVGPAIYIDEGNGEFVATKREND
jgi:arylsulfatase A-like enzyme